MSARPTPPPYTTGESIKALYLLIRGAGAAIRGTDPTGSKWDRALSELARAARARGEGTEEA